MNRLLLLLKMIVILFKVAAESKPSTVTEQPFTIYTLDHNPRILRYRRLPHVYIRHRHSFNPT
uniref:Uncharacterized protein n=1 Tax=Trichobilharzia regenti TaxID=157069 RepID=A0AA85JXQ6_TRIRE|nr:unnamed protein product [Trichobilharzia regenti]